MDTSTQEKTKEALLEYVLTLDDERMVAETATEQFVCATEGFFVVSALPWVSGMSFSWSPCSAVLPFNMTDPGYQYSLLSK